MIQEHMKQCTCLHTNYHNTTNHNRYLHSLNCFACVISSSSTHADSMNFSDSLSLSLSLSIHPYHPLLPSGLQNYILWSRRAKVNKFLLAHPCVRVHRRMSLMNLSLLLQQCSTYLVRLTWTVFEMGGKCPYSCCFLRCCFQDLFRIACSTLV